jgi:hypothetical protein
MEIQHAGVRLPAFDRPVYAVVIQVAGAAKPPGETFLRANVIAREHVQTAKAP